MTRRQQAQKASAELVIAPTTEGAQRAGVCVWWDLSGEVPVTAVEEVFRRYGVPEELGMPTPATPGIALKAAANRTAGDGGIVRSVKSGPWKGGLAIMTTVVGDDGRPTAHTVAVAKVDDDGEFIADGPPAYTEPWQRYYDHERTHVRGTDVSKWLSRHAMDKLNAVCLRPTGGFYFVPEARVGEWMRVAEALRNLADHDVYHLDAHNRSTAIRSVLKAIEQEAEELVRTVRERHAERNMEDGRSKRAAKGDVGKLDAMLRKMGEYERCLGTSLETLRARCSETRQKVGAEILDDLGDMEEV